MDSSAPDFEALHREVSPSVVSVYAGDGDARGGGSGFVFRAPDADDVVVTNEHVVGDAATVDLRFAEGDWRTGAVVGTDPYTDLAAVDVSDPPAYAAPLALAADAPRPGQAVAAFGNPLGLDGTITTGVVSGTNRSSPTGRGFTIPDTVQTDAAINPGNSGGPLVTAGGEVVGVNRAKSGDNIGFAVSAALVGRVVPELVATGSYRHPYLRVRTVDVSPTVATANGLDEPVGVLVVDVGEGPAEGVLVGCDAAAEVDGRRVPVGGDVVVGLDGAPVRSHEELLRYLMTEVRPGEAVEVELVRDGEATVETITLAERPGPRDRQGGRRGGRPGTDPRGRDIPVE